MKKDVLEKLMTKIEEDIITIGAYKMDCQEPEKSQEAQGIINFYWSVYDELKRQFQNPHYIINQVLLEKYYKRLKDEAYFFNKGLCVL